MTENEPIIADATNVTVPHNLSTVLVDQEASWEHRIVSELEAMGIQVLRVTDTDFPQQVDKSLAATQRKRTEELLSVLGMVAYATSVGQLVELSHHLGDVIGRRVRSDVNIPALGLEATFGHSQMYCSALGKIIQLAIKRKFTAQRLIEYISRCGGLDRAVKQARLDLKAVKNCDNGREPELNQNTDGSLRDDPSETPEEQKTNDQRAGGVPDDLLDASAPPGELQPPHDHGPSDAEEVEDTQIDCLRRRRVFRDGIDADSRDGRLHFTVPDDVLRGLAELHDGDHIATVVLRKVGKQAELSFAVVDSRIESPIRFKAYADFPISGLGTLSVEAKEQFRKEFVDGVGWD